MRSQRNGSLELFLLSLQRSGSDPKVLAVAVGVLASSGGVVLWLTSVGDNRLGSRRPRDFLLLPVELVRTSSCTHRSAEGCGAGIGLGAVRIIRFVRRHA